MIVRRALVEDIERVADLGQKFFDESGYVGLIEFDRPTILDLIEKSFDDQYNFGIFVAETDLIIGIAGIMAVPFFFNRNHSIAQELFWYVEPDERGGRAGIMLYHAIDQWVRQKASTILGMTALENESRESVESFYKKMGFKPSDHGWIKEIK